MGLTTISTFLAILTVQFSLLRAHREHKVHNIVLYPDKHSWCKTTPIKQVVTSPQCSSQELDNNVCVGACFSYMVPHSEPSAPGDLIRPYCDSCQPLDSIWHTVTLDCKDEESKPITMQKQVQIITNCSCSSCTETSKIKLDYAPLLQEPLPEENLDKNLNIVDDTPDILLTPTIDASGNNSRDVVLDPEKVLQLLGQLKEPEGVEKVSPVMREINQDNFENVEELLVKLEKREPEHKPHHVGSMHRGPHHSLVLDPDVKEKIDVEPHHLHPAVAGQEISYHDNILGEKDKKKDF
ncbi:uncharacterized protein [Neodiprion pinetum]|uniref:Uncharacterized protein LOC107220207 n=2 Tax=Neodiprion TaxID=270857 RepID=A0A6J0BHB9_NEOLC|nr:uncharacterized protein LOC107220207 [Neodiprion lecontei]XP_046489553.1 uncharacterized protein LOC124222521 [Neodiprion pinetum]